MLQLRGRRIGLIGDRCLIFFFQFLKLGTAFGERGDLFQPVLPFLRMDHGGDQLAQLRLLGFVFDQFKPTGQIIFHLPRRQPGREAVAFQGPPHDLSARIIHDGVHPIHGEDPGEHQNHQRTDQSHPHQRPPGPPAGPLFQIVKHRLHAGIAMMGIERQAAVQNRRQLAVDSGDRFSHVQPGRCVEQFPVLRQPLFQARRLVAAFRPLRSCNTADSPSACGTRSPPRHKRPSGRRAPPRGRPVRGPCKTACPARAFARRTSGPGRNPRAGAAGPDPTARSPASNRSAECPWRGRASGRWRFAGSAARLPRWRFPRPDSSQSAREPCSTYSITQ